MLTNISRSKGNHAMKLSQVIEYDTRNIFLKTHAQNVVVNLFPDPFLKNKNRAYLWINTLKFYVVFM